MKLAKFYYVLALLIGIALAGVTYHSALAQCLDAAGGSIPCPPEKERKTPVPPIVPTSTSTSTPFPLAALPTNTATNQPPGITPTLPGAGPLVITNQQPDGTTNGEDWDESCSWASCFAYDIMCSIGGGSGYGQDDGAGGTVYHCDVPDKSAEGSNPLIILKQWA